MRRVLVLGRGGAGKTRFARDLGARTGLPVIELDQHFWGPDRAAPGDAEWVGIQERLAGPPTWIMDGDFGPYDEPAPRLRAADTVVVLDFGLPRCAWRAVRRGPERADFWRWVVTWRRRWRPLVLAAVAVHAPSAELHVLRGPRAVRRFLAGA